MSLTLGSRLGSYEISAPIGAGGMGEVFRARDTKLNRDVAIKVLPAAFAQDPERLARFAREAQTLASLNHPNIATVYGIEDVPAADGASKGSRAIVMELVAGEDLSARIARGPIPVALALPILRQIADALEAAHEQGVIHRDLKPANLRLTPDGKVKILDFGVAKACEADWPAVLAGEALSAATTQAAPLTEAGVIQGTPAYMSPEQARGQVLDQRSDIWGFGCILYEMLTGRRPFSGSTPAEMFAMILEREPDWMALPVETPSSLRRTLQRCLQKDLKQRLRHIGDAVLEPDTTARGEVPAATATRTAFRPLVAALALSGWALVAVLLLRPDPPVASWTREATEFDIDAGDGESLAVSADGRTIAWVGTGTDGATRVKVRSLSSAAARELPGTEGASYPFLSPDGKALGFFADGQLKRIDVASGVVQVLAETPGVSLGGAWNSSGDIVFSNRYGLQRIAATGGEAREVAGLDTARQENSLRYPHFLPDGRRFVYVARSGRPEKNSAYLGSLDGPPRRIFATQSKVAFAPPGRLLFLREGTLVAQGFEPDTLKLDPDPVTVATDVAARTLGIGGGFAVSGAGLLVYTHASPRATFSLRWRDRSGRDLGVFAEPDAYAQFRLAPDARRAAVAINDAKAGSRSVWILEGGHTPRRLTFPGTHDWQPVWSPDGARVAFSSYRDGLSNIYVKSAAGSGNDEPLVLSADQKDLGDFSPDGRYLVYRDTDRNLKGDIVVMDLTGGGKRIEVTSGGASDEGAPRFSGDGRWVAYESDETGRFEVFVQPFPPTGARWQVSVNGGREPAWRSDGGEFYYIDGVGRVMALPVDRRALSFAPGGPQPLFAHTPRARFTNSYDVAGDGSRFLVAMATPRGRAPRSTVVLNWAAALRK